MKTCLFALILVGAVSEVEAAATYTWTNTLGGAFSTAANWQVGGGAAATAPTEADNLLFEKGKYTITLSGDTSVTSMKVIAAGRSDDLAKYVTFDLGGHALSLTDTTAKVNQIDVNQNIEPPAEWANGCYDARLVVSNGTLNAASAILIGNGSYNHRGYLKITDATYNGSLGLVGSSLLLVENGGVWNCPSDATLGTERSGFTPECCTRMIVDGLGSKAIINGRLWWNNTYDRLTITNQAYVKCTTFILKRSGGGGGSHAYADVVDHACVTNTGNCQLGTQGGVNGASYDVLTIGNHSSWYCGSSAQLGQDGSVGNAIRVWGKSDFSAGNLKIGQGGTATSNVFELVDSFCALRETSTETMMISGNYNSSAGRDNGIRIAGASARFEIAGGVKMYKDAGSFIAFEIPENGFVDGQGAARVPFYSKSAFAMPAKTAGYASSGASRLVLTARQWSRKHPKESLTLMKFDTASKDALQALADSVVYTDLKPELAAQASVTVSTDGKSLVFTAPPNPGMVLLFR